MPQTRNVVAHGRKEVYTVEIKAFVHEKIRAVQYHSNSVFKKSVCMLKRTCQCQLKFIVRCLSCIPDFLSYMNHIFCV